MMLDMWQSGRVYHFDPEAYKQYNEGILAKPEFPETIFLEFEPGFIDKLSAEAISNLFSEFGDFYV